MPLRPDFKVWFDIIAEYRYHEDLRRNWPIRSDDYYNLKEENWLERSVERLKEKRSDFPREQEAIEGSLKILKNVLNKNPELGEVVFTREGKPFYILENLKVLSKWHTVCILVDLDKLVKFGCITIQDKEKLERENARKKILLAAGVYATLCAVATWIGDIIRVPS